MSDDPPEYTPDQRRVCDYLIELTGGQIGCGPDPIGFLIASHAWLRITLAEARQDLTDMQAAVDDPDNQPLTTEQIARLKPRVDMAAVHDDVARRYPNVLKVLHDSEKEEP